MTTLEFKTALENAKTLDELRTLRSEVSSKMVKQVKDKIETLGMESFEISTTSLKVLIGVNSDTNTLTEIVVPMKNITLKKFAGKKVNAYVQSKLSGGARSEILVEQI